MNLNKAVNILCKKFSPPPNPQLMIVIEFVFDYVQLLYYKCQKINLNQGGSYLDSPNCIKSKKATINLINKKDNKCFQCAVTNALNYEEIKKIHKEQ